MRNTIRLEKRGKEEIRAYTHVIGESVVVQVGTGRKNDAGDFVFDQPQQYEQVTIEGADYVELLSAGPHWSPDKPAKNFRLNDLWIYVDQARAQP